MLVTLLVVWVVVVPVLTVLGACLLTGVLGRRSARVPRDSVTDSRPTVRTIEPRSSRDRSGLLHSGR